MLFSLGRQFYRFTMYECIIYTLTKRIEKKNRGHLLKNATSYFEKNSGNNPPRNNSCTVTNPHIKKTSKDDEQPMRNTVGEAKKNSKVLCFSMDPNTQTCRPTRPYLYQLCLNSAYRFGELTLVMNERIGWRESQQNLCCQCDLIIMILRLFLLLCLLLIATYYSSFNPFFFHWSLNDKSSPVSRALLSVRADLNSARVWKVSIFPLISTSSGLFSRFSRTVRRAPTTIGIIVPQLFQLSVRILVSVYLFAWKFHLN